MLTDSQLTLLAIASTISGTIIIAGYFLGLMLKNQRLQMVAREEILEWGITIFLIGTLAYIISEPLPVFSCKVVTWLLSESVNCDDPTARDNYVADAINEQLQIAYTIIGDPRMTEQLTRLLQGSLSRTAISIPIGTTAFRNPFTDAAGLGDVLTGKLDQLVKPPTGIEANIVKEVQSFKQDILDTQLGGTTTFSYQPCNYFLLYYDYATQYINMYTQFKSTLYAVSLLVQDLYRGFVWGFLIVGLFLRNFNISRRIGGFFISFSIAVAMLPYITVFFLKILQKVDTNFWITVSSDKVITDIQQFTEISAIGGGGDPSYYCDENFPLYISNFNRLYSISTDPNSGLVSFGVYGLMVLLSLGMSLLAVISITVGIGQLFGIEISPFVLSYIARLR